MKDYISIEDREGKQIIIFSRHIAFIDQDSQGAVIHLFSSGVHIDIKTKWSPMALLTQVLPDNK